MKLWQIKSSALRLMFTDTDIEFSQEEFDNNSIYENPNTREKLVRMNDSISRAIDIYYDYCGAIKKRSNVTLEKDIEGNFLNTIDISSLENFGEPSKIDFVLYSEAIINKVENLSFYFNEMDNKLEIVNVDVLKGYLESYPESYFVLSYDLEKKNLDFGETYDDVTYDLDSIYIPKAIQRAIPFYIKEELYEEDEYLLANNSGSKYMASIMRFGKNTSNHQRNIKSIFRSE